MNTAGGLNHQLLAGATAGNPFGGGNVSIPFLQMLQQQVSFFVVRSASSFPANDTLQLSDR